MLNNNITSFGQKDDTNVAKFTAIYPNDFTGQDCGLTGEEHNQYWVRLSPRNGVWFNFNGNQYNSGTGVWTVENVVDMSEYHKITLNIIKGGDSESITRLAKTGEIVDVPQYEGYISNITSIVKDATDEQVVTINYTLTYTVKELTPGAYYIYYTDDSNTKHYLQTAGTNNITTVTDNPLYYTISNGITADGAYTAAYYLDMNGLRISNTNENGTDIKTESANGSQGSRVWTSQVFLEKDGKCAIRLTNSTTTDGWHGNYFIGKGQTEGTTIAVEPANVEYIWTVEKAPLSYILNDNYGNQYTGSIADWTAFDENGVLQGISGTEQCPITEATLNNNTITATITFPFAASSTTAINSTMIANFNSTQKWHAVDGAVKVQTANATSEDILSWMWAIYPSIDNNALTVKIQNLATDQWVVLDESNTAIPNDQENPAVTLTDTKDNASALEVVTWLNAPCFKVPNKSLYLSINSTNDTNTFLCVYTGANTSHQGNKIHFPAISYDLTIGDIKAATLYTPFAVTIPENVKAKYITVEGNSNAVNSGILKYTAIENTIPANTAVVVLGEAGTYTFNAATEEGTEVNGNLLFGYAKATPVADHEGTGADGTVYALHATRGAFGHFTGTTYRAGKAYLDVTSLGENAGRISFFSIFDEGTETGIENIQGNEESGNGIAYDLSGRRVQATAKGLYIINGKKVIK